jgi:hypothetical protein
MDPKELLLRKKQELEKALEQIMANFHATRGAVLILNQVLAELDAPAQEAGPEEECTGPVLVLK